MKNKRPTRAEEHEALALLERALRTKCEIRHCHNHGWGGTRPPLVSQGGESFSLIYSGVEMARGGSLLALALQMGFSGLQIKQPRRKK